MTFALAILYADGAIVGETDGPLGATVGVGMGEPAGYKLL